MKLRALLQIPRRPRRSVRRNHVAGCAFRASRRSSLRVRNQVRGPAGVRANRADPGRDPRRNGERIAEASFVCEERLAGLVHVCWRRAWAAREPRTRAAPHSNAPEHAPHAGSRRVAAKRRGRARAQCAATCAAPSSVARNRFRATRGLLAAEGEDVLGDRKAQRDAADVAVEVRRAVRAQREGVERPVHAQVDA